PAKPATAVSADTWAVVDGRPIMRDDVEKAFRRTPEAAQGLSDEESVTAKLSLLNDLIVQDILLAKAKALKIEVPAADLGAAFAELAMGFSEDAETAPRGGDLGLIPVSKLKQLPPQLRDAVLNKTPGSVNVASANGGHTLVLVISHEQAGQRDLTTPGVRE